DFMLGNTNVLVVASMVPAVFGRSRVRNGLLVGLATAAFGKPLMIPVLLWLAIWRRSTFAGAMVAGAVATAIGVGVFGPGSYRDWVTAVGARSSFLSTPFAGNHGVTALAPAAWVPVATLVAVLLLIVLVRRGPGTGLVWALASGVLLAPYAGTYAALPIVLTLPFVGSMSPMLALAMVAVSPVATTIPLPLYAGGILVAVLALREPRAGANASWSPAGIARQPPVSRVGP
ncbi:MAG: DUF2029 domain-containing protein, partial [Chloroflexi bacterium]|nr:DUF2029 domain-containing protein [Chloroflexota bacterium]